MPAEALAKAGLYTLNYSGLGLGLALAQTMHERMIPPPVRTVLLDGEFEIWGLALGVGEGMFAEGEALEALGLAVGCGFFC